MSNETFEGLYNKYENMIKLFVRKYNGLLEEEEIRQCCLIAIMKAYKSYNANSKMKFSTWVYSNMKWELYREIRNTKHLVRDYISLQAPFNGTDNDNITLADTLEDNNVDIEEEVFNRMITDIYKTEVARCITDKKKLDVVLLRWFEGCSYSYIEKVLGCKNVSRIIIQCRESLLSRSELFKEEYEKIHHINIYNPTSFLALY